MCDFTIDGDGKEKVPIQVEDNFEEVVWRT